MKKSKTKKKKPVSPPALRRGAGLSPRETEILKMISNGETDKTIAEKLNISVHTPGTHRQHIYRKLGVNNAAGAVREATKRGWL